MYRCARIRLLNLIFLLIGVNFLCIQGAYADLENGLDRSISSESNNEVEKSGLIVVEPIGVESNIRGGKYALVPYRERRPAWTKTYGLSWGNYDPIDYDSDFSAEVFEDIFDIQNSSLIEFEISMQRNFKMGSLGADMAIGFYNAQATDDYVDATSDNIRISLIPLRLGARFNLDTVMETPYVVPYAGAGIYTMFYTETLNSRTVEGSTAPSLYFNVGLKFQLDWLEPRVARVAYQEHGLQNSFLFAEARQFFKSSTEADPNFSGDLNFNVGISVEL
ncbi:MAG: hypothetical protein R2827_01725 [Bdellovibrionales bacterium]